jgi:hypothetical protein
MRLLPRLRASVRPIRARKNADARRVKSGKSANSGVESARPIKKGLLAQPLERQENSLDQNRARRPTRKKRPIAPE